MNNPAAVYRGDGRFEIVDEPVMAPGPGEVRLEIAFCGICGTDLHAYLGHMDARIGDQRVLGHEMAGTVVEVGEGVADHHCGDRVVVRPLDNCGDCPACNNDLSHICHNLKFMGIDTDGAFKRFWTVPAKLLHALPDKLSLAAAALVEPTAVAVHDVRRARLKAGECALVIGGGPIGTLIALTAKAEGADVILSEINPTRIRMANAMGLDAVNPLETDVVALINKRTGNKGADVVFEVSGSQPGVDLMTEVAATRGRIVMVAIHASRPLVDLFRFFWRELELIGARVYEPGDFDRALELLGSGAIDVDAIITDQQPLERIGDAFASLTGNAEALKTLITITPGE